MKASVPAKNRLQTPAAAKATAATSVKFHAVPKTADTTTAEYAVQSTLKFAHATPAVAEKRNVQPLKQNKKQGVMSYGLTPFPFLTHVRQNSIFYDKNKITYLQNLFIVLKYEYETVKALFIIKLQQKGTTKYEKIYLRFIRKPYARNNYHRRSRHNSYILFGACCKHRMLHCRHNLPYCGGVLFFQERRIEKI